MVLRATLRRLAFVLLLPPAGAAQTLAAPELVQGGTAQLEVEGATPLGLEIFLVGFAGLTPPVVCLQPGDACLELALPVYVVGTAVAQADGTAVLALPLPSSVPPVSLSAQVLEVTPSGTFGASPAVTSPIQPIGALGDDFEGGALDPGWQVLHPELATVEVTGGELRITPTASGGAATWFDDGEGPLVYKEVTGDFAIRGVVRSQLVGDPAQPPPPQYRLGGFLVRAPGAGPGEHDFAHVAVGAGTFSVPVAVEEKNTFASVSDFTLTPVAAPAVELRLSRSGAVIELAYRELGAPSWTVLASDAHPALPGTVQVGPMCYSNNSPPLITTRFEAVVFEP